jgi:hypothetical protein
MNLTRTRNKLLKNGYICIIQEARKGGGGYDEWTDLQQGGTNISFYNDDGEEVAGALEIHGRIPDRPQFDEFNSTHSRSVKEAIMFSRPFMRRVQ